MISMLIYLRVASVQAFEMLFWMWLNRSMD